MSNFDFQKAINGEPIYCNGEYAEKYNLDSHYNDLGIRSFEIWVEE